MAARLGPQNAKAILDIMVRDALDETGKNFLRTDSRKGVSYFEQPRCGPKCRSVGISATVSFFRISAVSRHSIAAGYALVFLCSPLVHLPLASERSAGIENSCLTSCDSRSISIATGSLAGNVCSSASSSSASRWASALEDGSMRFVFDRHDLKDLLQLLLEYLIYRLDEMADVQN